MKRLFLALIMLVHFTAAHGQAINSFADSIRIKYKIPELAYSVVSSDSIYEMEVLGIQRANTNYHANVNDKFRIGSITKTITSLIATLTVKQGKLKWDTKFFDLYPELKSQSDVAYYNLTLKDLLTFRAPIIGWTYTYQTPTKKEVTGDARQQRYNFIAWVLKQHPISEKRTYYWSNPSYVMVGLMLEKITGKNYEALVEELGKNLNIEFGFGQPNLKDNKQPWGHNENYEPEKPNSNYKLNWLSSAGNINVSLPDFSKFIQLQLQGLLGKSTILTQEESERMHYGFPEFAFGWNWYLDASTKYRYSFHEGNPGTFLTKAFVCKDKDKAFIVFANIQTDEAERGLRIMIDELRRKYGS